MGTGRPSPTHGNMHRITLPGLASAALVLALGCARATAPAVVARAEGPPTCAQAVRVFPAADLVDGDYQELSLLPWGARVAPDSDPQALERLRGRAAALGGNALILRADTDPVKRITIIGRPLGTAVERRGAAVAIHVPERAAETISICRGETAPEDEILGYAPVEDSEAATTDTDTGASQPTPERITSAERTELLVTDPRMRDALADVRRLRIVSDYHEDQPGVLVLALASGYESSRSVEYNLLRLHQAYEAVHHYEIPTTLELWRNGRRVGKVTRNGMVLGPHSDALQPTP
jgi:hypothetical protein